MTGSGDFPEWTYHPSRELDETLAMRLQRFPREPDMLVYGLRSGGAIAVRAWLRAYHRLEIHGRHHLPAEGSFILACNHTSHLDALCLLAALPLRRLHRTFPAAAQEYFFRNLARGSLSAVLLNAVPFRRREGMAASLTLCRGLLAMPGNVLIIFPEGTRTTTGELGSFKPGIGILAAGSPVPVLPCRLDGGFRAFPKGAWLPRPRKLRLHIGPPRTYEDLPPGRESALKVAADLRQAVLSLDPAPSLPEPA